MTSKNTVIHIYWANIEVNFRLLLFFSVNTSYLYVILCNQKCKLIDYKKKTKSIYLECIIILYFILGGRVSSGTNKVFNLTKKTDACIFFLP